MISHLIFFTFVPYITCTVYINVDYKNKTQVEIFKKYEQAVCFNREKLCGNVSEPTLCAVRTNNQTNKTEYRDFRDSCRLFIYNFCDSPGQEYYIVAGGTCESYLRSRRSEDNPTEDDNTGQEETDAPSVSVKETKPSKKTTVGIVYIPKTNRLVLRQIYSPKTTKKPYGITSAEDGHPCPYYCPNTYDPQCMNVNSGAGLYFNFKVFINHCQLDMYYCKYFNDRKKFPMPPYPDLWGVKTSKLSYTACADVRYIQFARFSEAASTMVHFGWLPDKHRYSHVLRPGERKPGFG